MEPNRRKQGFALLQVMLVVGVATIIGSALLAGAVLQSDAGRAADASARADAMADSGVSLAMYYLQNPDKAPAAEVSGGYWRGTLADLAPVPGSGDALRVSVTRDAARPGEYVVISSGKVAGDGGAVVIRRCEARLKAQSGIVRDKAIVSRKDLALALNGKVYGDVLVQDKLTSNRGTISGTAWAASFVNTLASYGAMQTLPAGAVVNGPSKSTLEMYTGTAAAPNTYAHTDGRVYTRGTITKNTLTSADTIAANAGNAAGIHYYEGDLTLRDFVRIDGTLIVKGNLIINGTSIVITPQDGYPALIVTGDLRTRAYKSATINGAVFVGKGIVGDSGPSSSTTLTINGALYFDGPGNIDSTAAMTVTIKHTPGNLNVPDMDTALARNVSVLSWSRL